MSDRTIELVARQYAEYVRERSRHDPNSGDEPRSSLRRRTSRGLHRIADAVDPGEL